VGLLLDRRGQFLAGLRLAKGFLGDGLHGVDGLLVLGLDFSGEFSRRLVVGAHDFLLERCEIYPRNAFSSATASFAVSLSDSLRSRCDRPRLAIAVAWLFEKPA